jgi:hypothetical protein
MRKLAIKLFLFLIPVISLGGITEYLLRLIPNDYKTKELFYEKHAKEINILCLGESHAFSGIDPTYLQLKSFNGSHVMQSLNYDLAVLEKHENKLTALKYLLVPISYNSFTERLENGREKWRVKNYFLYYKTRTILPPAYYTEILSLPLQINIGRLTDYYIKKSSPITTDSLGHGLEYKLENQKNLAQTGKIAARIQTSANFNNWEKNVRDLNKIASICKKKNITLILFTPPASSYYAKNLDLEQLKKTISSAQHITSKNKNIYYINFLHDINFTDNDFYDANHLSEFGAQKLTKKINTFIINLEKNIQTSQKRCFFYGY